MVLHRRSTTADGDAVGTSVIMAATVAAICRGVIGGRSISDVSTCIIRILLSIENEEKLSQQNPAAKKLL